MLTLIAAWAIGGGMGNGVVAAVLAGVSEADRTISSPELDSYALGLTASDEAMVSDTFRFVSWGDTKSVRDELAALSNQAVLLNPAFTIYEGDLESDGFTLSGMNAWQDAMNGYSNNGMFDKTLPVRGNHDSNDTAGWQAYYDMRATAQALGATNYSALDEDLTYSFDYGNSHFIGVDVLGDEGLLTSEQVNWIESDLSAAEARGLTHAFVYFHGPIYCLDGHCSCTTRICSLDPNVVSLIEVFNNHPIISATFHGHEHTYAYVHIDETRIPEASHPFEQFVTGSAGAGPNDCIPGRADYCLPADGFVTVDVSGQAFIVSFYELGAASPVKTMAFSKSGNEAPIVDAGADQAITLPDSATLGGTVSDDGLPDPPGAVTALWSQVSGPGTVTFEDTSAVNTTASFSERGVYVLRLTADDGELPASDEVIVTVNSTIRVPQDYATIQAAVDAALSGDLVLVSPGLYAENVVLADKTITLASEFYTTQDAGDIEQTVIDAGGGTAINVGASAGPGTRIIGFTIQNGQDGILSTGELEILHNRFVGNADAVDYDGGGGLCRYNLFEYNSDDAVDLDLATQATIEDNIIRNNGDDGIEIRLHDYTGPVLNIIIRNNTISGNDEDGIQIIDYRGISDRFLLIEHNLIEGNAMVGLGLMDNGDTVEDFRGASIPERIQVYSNTFVDNDHGLTGGDNLIALNNLFVNSTTLALKRVDGDSIAAYNLFWNNGTDEFHSNVDPATTLYTDPLLDSEYRLQPESPAIDAGTATFEWLGEIVLDLDDSEYFAQAPDLGAYEYVPGTPPTVTISAPADGAGYYQGEAILFTGSASDAEDGELTAGLVWQSSLDGAIGSGGSFSRSDLSAGTHTITATVNDTHGMGGWDQVAITVNAPPTVTISAPVDGTTYDQGEAIPFTGSASDAEDGDLTPGLAWQSSLDGPLGSGGAFSRSDLSVGLHVISATVTDTRGLSGSDRVTITINAPPMVTISAPPDGASYNQGEVITFTASASDEEDGDLTVDLTWQSSLDGLVGSGGSFARSDLSAGLHTIAATVTDTHGLSASDQATITINAPPTVTISAPADGASYDQGEAITFTGGASDPEDGDLTPSLVWLSSLDGPVGSGGSFTRSDLSVGLHVISATVTDTHGLSGSSQVTMTINAPPMVSIIRPLDGASYNQGEAIPFIGHANDAEDGELTASLVWQSSLDGVIGSGGLFIRSDLSIRRHTITATVTDSHGLRGWDQVTITVNAPPTVTISAPPDGASYDLGEFISFTGSADDPEDGNLTVGLAWQSSLDGPIGSGGSFNRSDLSRGRHTITATVTDTHGLSASDMVTLTINVPPTVTISAPVDGARYDQGEAVTFTATASDAEDGDLTPDLAWQSSLDGPIGSGGSFSKSDLSGGRHTITATVTDTHGLSTLDMVTLTINALPAVTISAPPNGASFSEGDWIAFLGSALDLEDGDLTANLSWSSNLDGDIGTEGSFSRTDLTPGVHTVTASVMDSGSLTGTDQIIITVTLSAPDTDPPAPDPMTWAVAPVPAGSSSISMTATTGYDKNGVEYYFACTAGGGHDSGWQDSPTYTDTGLRPQTEYTYQVKARDKSAHQNETGWSSPASATTGGAVVYLPLVSRARASGLQNPRSDPGFSDR